MNFNINHAPQPETRDNVEAEMEGDPLKSYISDALVSARWKGKFHKTCFLSQPLPSPTSELPVATPNEFYMNPFPRRAARAAKLIATKRTLPLDLLVKRKVLDSPSPAVSRFNQVSLWPLSCPRICFADVKNKFDLFFFRFISSAFWICSHVWLRITNEGASEFRQVKGPLDDGRVSLR